ncbi:MAG: gamma-glutamylcyclotransferase family protein [Candidatus Jordarchaeales archaeon]|nr:gamma-glutamylcyclotransferase [Candidatus Jordarchaeia archaeon]
MDVDLNSLFAYGTLMDTSFLKKRWNIEPVSVEDGFIIGRLYRAGWFPVFIEDPEGFKVYGKLLRVKDLASVIKSIDYYEGYDESDPASLFIRKRMRVFISSGGEEDAWVYVGNPKNSRIRGVCVPKNLIADGRWRQK